MSIYQEYETAGLPNPYKKQHDVSGDDSNQLAHMQGRSMPDTTAPPTAAPGLSIHDSDNPIRGPYNEVMPVVQSGAKPTPAAQSKDIMNPAIYQAQGNTVGYPQPSPGSVLRSHSVHNTRVEAHPNMPAPGAPGGQQVTRTALATIDGNVNRLVPSVNPMQHAYYNAPSAKWNMENNQQVIQLSFEDARKLHQYVMSGWHQWPVVARDREIPPLYAYVARGPRHLPYTVPANGLLGQLLTPRPSGTNRFGQQPSSAQHPTANSRPCKAPVKTAPKKGGRGRPKKQANIEEDQTHVDMIDYHGPAKTRRLAARSNHAQQLQVPVVQPGSMQAPEIRQPPQASSVGTLREAGSTGTAPAAFPLDTNGKSQELNGQAHGERQPSTAGAHGSNGVHLGTQFNTVSSDLLPSHQGQRKVEDLVISARPSSANDRKRSRESNEAEPNTGHEAKKARTTPSISNLNDRGKPEIPQQKQKATQGPSKMYKPDDDQPTIQVCIGNLDPRAAGAALNMALDALRSGQALVKARPGDDILCVPHHSHIVCLPPNASIAYYGPSNTLAAGRRWQEMPATSFSAGLTASSQHYSLAMAGVPIQDIQIEVFDRREHHLTAVLAEPNPETNLSGNTAPISVDTHLDLSEGPRCLEKQRPSDRDHTSDTTAPRKAFFFENQQDDALPGTVILASYPEYHVMSDSIRDSEQAIINPAGSLPVGIMDKLGLAATGTEFADTGAILDILDTIMNDPTIPGLEDLNAASDKSNCADTPGLNSGEVVCLDSQDDAHQGDRVIPLAPAARSDDAVPHKSPQDTANVSPLNTNLVPQASSGSVVMTREPMQAPVGSILEIASPSTASLEQIAEAVELSKKISEPAKSEIAWDAHLRENYSGNPDENEKPEITPADVAERQASLPPNDADDTNKDDDEYSLLKELEAVDSNEIDDQNPFGFSCAA